MSDTVLVTGGAGFIGSHLVDELVRRGFKVRLLARESSSLNFIQILADEGTVEVVRGDITDPGSIKGSAADCSIVYHAAALSRDWGPRKDFMKVNVDGTRNIVEECRAAGVRHLIYISTCGVIGEEDQKEPKDESAQYNPHFPYFMSSIFPSAMNHYRETKMLGEKAAVTLCSQWGIALTVARPVWVYGERELHSGPFILTRTASKGSRFIPGDPGTRFHTAYVKDIAQALSMLAGREPSVTTFYMIGPREPLRLEEYHSRFMGGVGSKGPRYLRKTVAYPIGFMMELVCTILRTRNPPLLTRARVNMGFFNNVFDTSKFKREIGEMKETPFEIGVQRSISWWKENGLL